VPSSERLAARRGCRLGILRRSFLIPRQSADTAGIPKLAAPHPVQNCDRLTRRKQFASISLEEALEESLEDISAQLEPQRWVEEKEMQNQVRDAVACLPENERVVVLLFYMGNHSQQDIAEFLEVPVSTVKQRLYTARKKLKEKMIQMVQEDLQEQRPSKNDDFVVSVGENIKQLLNDYRAQLKTDPASADSALLKTAQSRLYAVMQQNPVDPAIAHAAADLSVDYGMDKEATVDLLSRYLQQELTSDEEEWALTELVRGLSMLKRPEGTVIAQQQFLEWARESLGPDSWLWVMSINTECAYYWVETGHAEEWLRIFEELMATVAPSPENREARMVYVRTAGCVLMKLGRYAEVLAVARRMRDIANEDREWQWFLRTHIDAAGTEISALREQENTDEIRRIGMEATTLIHEHRSRFDETDKAKASDLSHAYHNMGAYMHHSSQYDLAIPLFRGSVEMKSHECYPYFWLAASLWATQGDRNEVIEFIRMGIAREFRKALVPTKRPSMWTQLPEFKDVKDEPEFVNAVNR
jgi:tetratricopeptide (TPR) repeat protein